MQISTIRPGLLVSLKTSLRGNVSYAVQDVEPNAETLAYDSDRQEVKAWQTTRTTADKAEYDRAIVARSRCRSVILKHCISSTFGYLCPEKARDSLDAGIAEARTIADGFNGDDSMTQIAINVLVGRIADDDVEAVRAINSEVMTLLDAMSRGIANIAAKAIREAANKATQLGKVLEPEANERVRAAVETARAAARNIKEAGETAAQEVDRQAIQKLREARVSFLDVDSEASEIETQEVNGRAVDLEPAGWTEVEAAEPDAIEAAQAQIAEAAATAQREAEAAQTERARYVRVPEIDFE